jgi:predicted TIM-barrel fold metal-dependent hydrolase
MCHNMVETNKLSALPKNIIDTHVHVWTDEFGKYPLAKGLQPQDMEPRTFVPQDILSRAQPSGVGRVVLVQMSYYGADNSYMLDVMAQWPKIFAGVAVIDWNESHPEIEMRRLACLGITGFRIYPEGDPADTCLDNDGIDGMFRCAAEDQLAICLLINPEALAAVERKCKRFPETTVVIDHLARIGMAGPIKSSDVHSLCSLARFPNIKVKVSAFYALGEKKPPHSDLVPLIRQVYESFGEQRLMWGSDCPFQLMSETYQDSLSVVQDTLSFLTQEAKKWILTGTAEATFFP